MARMIPCSTPTAKTTKPVRQAMANSLARSARIFFSPGMSMRLTPIMNTMPASVASGMLVSRLVRNSANSRTTADMVMFDTCDRPPFSSRIWVLVGLPLTTKVPESPAAKSAADSPTMSRLMSTRSPCLAAKLREVAALWATIRTKQEKATPNTSTASLRVTPCGRPNGGGPAGTAPTTATPSAVASIAVEMAMHAKTAIRAPGIFGMNLLNPMINTSVNAAKPTVVMFASGMEVIIVHCCWNQLPVPLGTPSMAGICPLNTWMPTPVRNPTSTDVLRKSPMNPSLRSRARSSIPPTTSAVRLHQATHSSEYGVSPATPRPASPAARTAAVAESAPTTSSLEEPRRANMRVGRITV